MSGTIAGKKSEKDLFPFLNTVIWYIITEAVIFLLFILWNFSIIVKEKIFEFDLLSI